MQTKPNTAPGRLRNTAIAAAVVLLAVFGLSLSLLLRRGLLLLRRGLLLLLCPRLLVILR